MVQELLNVEVRVGIVWCTIIGKDYLELFLQCGIPVSFLRPEDTKSVGNAVT